MRQKSSNYGVEPIKFDLQMAQDSSLELAIVPL